MTESGQYTAEEVATLLRLDPEETATLVATDQGIQDRRLVELLVGRVERLEVELEATRSALESARSSDTWAIAAVFAVALFVQGVILVAVVVAG